MRFALAVLVLATSCRAADTTPSSAPSSSAPLSSEPPSAKPRALGANEPGAVTIVDEAKVSIGEASAVVALGGGRFLVADDAEGVQLVELTEGQGRVRVLASMNDVEGLAKVGDRFVALEERSGVVWGFGLDGATTQLGVLAHPPSSGKTAKKNKGWEGIAFLPARLASDQKDHVVAVHEGAPKAVAVFAWPALTPENVIELSGALDDALGDLSDVAVDPSTGELLLLSDESRRIARVRIDPRAGGALAIVRLVDLPVAEKEKPEGVTFDDTGSLWIVTDATGRLFRVMIAPEKPRER